MNITFKKSSEKDISVIAFLAVKIWNEHYTSFISKEQIDYMLAKMYSAESLLKQMNEEHQFTLVYFNNVAVGYISLSSNDEEKFFINKFYVDVTEHRKGIGSRLFEHILMQLPKYCIIELAVNRENYKAINFYFKQGFIIKHTLDIDIGGGFYMNDFLMVRK